jgi:hypothetical protein
MRRTDTGIQRGDFELPAATRNGHQRANAESTGGEKLWRVGLAIHREDLAIARERESSSAGKAAPISFFFSGH